jgi:hypothetical protein
VLSTLVSASASASASAVEAPPAELLRFLTSWLGVWPMPHRLRVAPSARRLATSASGEAEQFTGVRCDARFGGSTVLSVTPLRFTAVRSLVDQLSPHQQLIDVDELMKRLPNALDRPSATVVQTALRWTTTPAALPAPGAWRGSHLLAAGHRGSAEIEIRRISRFGHEIVMHLDHSTDWCLSASLLAQAARDVLSAGAVPVLRRDLDRPAVAAIASVAGFHDSRWQVLSLAPRSALPTTRPQQTRTLT